MSKHFNQATPVPQFDVVAVHELLGLLLRLSFLGAIQIDASDNVPVGV